MSDAQELVAEARRVAENAYAPYSRFRVGVVAVAEDGSRFAGANVENAAYPSGLCAETSAIGAAVSAGVRHIHTIAVGCLDADVVYPCGKCRQLMNEFGVKRIIVQDGEGGVREHSLEELLPYSFGPESLPD